MTPLKSEGNSISPFNRQQTLFLPSFPKKKPNSKITFCRTLNFNSFDRFQVNLHHQESI